MSPSPSDDFILAIASNPQMPRWNSSCSEFSCVISESTPHRSSAFFLVYTISLYHPTASVMVFYKLPPFCLCSWVTRDSLPPPTSTSVLLVFYQSRCFCFLSCDGLYNEPTSYNLITFCIVNSLLIIPDTVTCFLHLDPLTI